MGFYYDKVLPKLIKVAMGSRHFAPLRKESLAPAHGRVLELGVGSGANLSFYPAQGISELVGIDPHPAFEEMLTEAAGDLPFPFRFVCAAAECLPFPDHSFDTAVSTFTLCSVTDSSSVLRELKRLLKPDGVLILLEHGLAPDRVPRFLQNKLNGLQQCVAGGCQLTKDHFKDLENAGFKEIASGNFYLPKAPGFLSYIYQGRFSAPDSKV